MPAFEVLPLPTRARVEPGDDVAALLLEAARDRGLDLRDGDVVCVASKVVAKADGRRLPLGAGDLHVARRRLAEAEGVRVVADLPWVLVVETRHGFVCANAGIDTSNVAGGVALPLPDDPDGAAAAIRGALRERAGVDVGVVLTDTFGRPWRLGQTDVALGASGVEVLRDDRGGKDLEGATLEVTMVAVGDELAAAADLARGKADGTPFVLVRGLDVAGDQRGHHLVRPAEEDAFRYGGPTAIERAVLHGEAPPVDRGDDPVDRAIAIVRAAPDVGDVRIDRGEDGGVGWLTVSGDDPVAVGVALERLRLVLVARGRSCSREGQRLRLAR